MVSNTACGVAGCSNSRKNAPDAGFFRLPSIVTTDKRSEELSRDRRSQWLSKINQSEKFDCLRTCRKELNITCLWEAFY